MPRPTATKWSTGSLDIGVPGGRALPFAASAQLLIGDAVVVSGSVTVNKTAVTAQHLGRIGLVIGGKAFFGDTSQDILDIGEVAAAAVNDLVWVATAGIAYAVTDNTAILAGSYVAPSTTTAGRVRLATVTTDVAAGDTGKIIGMALDANGGVAGTKIRVVICLL